MFDTDCPTLVFPACLYSLLVPPQGVTVGLHTPKTYGHAMAACGKEVSSLLWDINKNG